MISFPHIEFSPSVRGVLGLSAYCKECSKLHRPPKETSAEYTRAYRKRHPERHKALHRLVQFKRRQKIEATCDGTITDAVLKEIYAREICFWCCCKINPVDRTLEHVIELCQGGSHSITNIEMACRSCNSSRKGRNSIVN